MNSVVSILNKFLYRYYNSGSYTGRDYKASQVAVYKASQVADYKASQAAL